MSRTKLVIFALLPLVAFALGLLWVAFFLQQGTRQVYGPLLGSIQSSIGATDVQLGLVSTVFTLV